VSKEVVFFDIDGTLIDCDEGIIRPTEKTKEALIALKNKGIKIVLASGRPKSFIDEDILKLSFDAIIASNGAYVEVDGEVIVNELISKIVVEEFISMCRENKMSFILEGQDVSIYEESRKEEVIKFCNDFHISESRLILMENYDGEIIANKLVLFINEEDKYKIFNDRFSKNFKFMMHPNNISWDIYSNDYSKASGIICVIEKLEVSIKDSYAFGDGINDIEMFQTVSKGISMGNARSELDKYTFYKTLSVKEEGIYYALKKLNMI
jgi:Cof subfamily protein (haloacid dehalogenase superfamily)